MVVMSRAARGALRELGLQLRRVEEHETGELDSGGRCIDRTGETLRDEMRDEAAVIEVRVRQYEGVDVARVVREGEPIALGLVRAALEHPTVDEHARLAGLEKVLGARHRGRAAEEVQPHARAILATGVRPRSERREGHAPS